MKRIKPTMKYTSSGCLFVFAIWVIVLFALSSLMITHTSIPWSLNLNALFEPVITGHTPPAVRFLCQVRHHYFYCTHAREYNKHNARIH